jgi:glyoxylase-like metal-dependent hydrolase (beta-lactamase superfamily II)
MNFRSRFAFSNIVLAALLVVPVAAQQQPDWESVEINTVKLTDGLYMLMGRGGNIGLSIGDDGAFVIDDQFAPLTDKIVAAISKLTDQPVRFVLNTHWHGDHTGGNENLGKAGAMIVAHDNVRKRMNPEAFKDLIGSSTQAPPAALPVITFSDEMNFHWNGDRIHVVHVTHSHTDGDAIVFFERQNVVHMGDTFFAGRYPFIDVNSGGSVQGMIASSSKVLGLVHPDTKIVPGHGDLAGAVELRAYRDMLEAARDAIAPMLARGMTEDEVVAAKPTAALDPTWGTNSERFVRSVYQSLVRAGH